ncbi:VWFA-related domain-containing protein [Granulicella rosea]|uniref:VWFA-related domain-containing protein n=1 Tax=Granulicella rosea TaxID=474952 RepID=A0A239K6L4_9BACT|nr:VWA domain-containing protein [Granulicella rosea]SNT12814.1 VWFA-related domain-containing protein [Granulicella rosea]
MVITSRGIVVAMRTPFFIIVCSLLCGPMISGRIAYAQTEPATEEPYRLRTTVRTVVLDVVVTDAKGRTVDNLKKEDFTLLEDLLPQRITSFERPEAHVMPSPGKLLVQSTADLPKVAGAPVTMLVLDELNSNFEDMAYARNRMEKYLNAQGPVLAQPTTLLAATNTAFEVIRDFTQDRAAILAALHKHQPDFPWKIMRGGNNSEIAFERLSQSLASLLQMTQATRGTPGRKTVIWVGKGFPGVDVTKLDADSETKIQNAMKSLTQSLLKARITLYTIDPESSLTSLPTLSDDLDNFVSQNNGQPFADEINFSTLAPATGGTALFSRNDIDAELSEQVTQGSHYYTLSYTPTDLSLDPDKYRRIHIKLSTPGLTATTRNGYYAMPDVDPAKEIAAKKPVEQKAQLEAEMGKAALSQIVYNGLNVTLDKADKGFKLGVPASELRWMTTSAGKSRAEITVMLVAFSRKGKAVAHSSDELSAEAAGQMQGSDQKALFLLSPLDAQGATRYRVVVRDAETGKIGTADMTQ